MMHLLRTTLLCFFVLFLGSGCKKNKPSPSKQQSRVNPTSSPKTRTATKKPQALTRAAIINKSKLIARSAFVTLSGQLKKAMKAGGVVHAIATCSKVAMPVTQGVGDKHKVTLARISHKPRNPKNTANAMERGLIKAYMTEMKQGKSIKPTVVKDKAGTQTFYGPIVLAMPVCLKCHGSVGKQVNQKDYAAIQKSYPQDKAIDFKMGDIRGLWKITFRN